MKKLMAVAALGAVLAAFSGQALAQFVPGAPCYIGEAVGSCPNP
jgi:hypothetical protein